MSIHSYTRSLCSPSLVVGNRVTLESSYFKRGENIGQAAQLDNIVSSGIVSNVTSFKCKKYTVVLSFSVGIIIIIITIINNNNYKTEVSKPMDHMLTLTTFPVDTTFPLFCFPLLFTDP